MATFSNLLRRLGEENPMEGCFASAGRGLGQTLRSVEDYISEVISRGVCYVDNTLEDIDEEVKVQKKELVPHADDGEADKPLDGVGDQEKTHLMAVDGHVRHRVKYNGTDEYPQDATMAAAEVWDVSGRDSPPYLPVGALACAPLVDTDVDPNDVYRLSSDSSAIATTAAMSTNLGLNPAFMSPYSSQTHGMTSSRMANALTKESNRLDDGADESSDMMNIKLI